jgi:hypothetical protein
VLAGAFVFRSVFFIAEYPVEAKTLEDESSGTRITQSSFQLFPALMPGGLGFSFEGDNCSIADLPQPEKAASIANFPIVEDRIRLEDARLGNFETRFRQLPIDQSGGIEAELYLGFRTSRSTHLPFLLGSADAALKAKLGLAAVRGSRQLGGGWNGLAATIAEMLLITHHRSYSIRVQKS